MRSRFLCGAILTVLLVAACAMPAGRAEQPAPEPFEPRVEPEADEVLRAASAFLAGLRSFRYEADITFDREFEEGNKLQFEAKLSVSLRRPDRFRVEYRGDLVERDYYYDGSAVTLYDVSGGAYATSDAPDTIDAALDDAAERHGIVVPMSDLLYADPYAVLMEQAVEGIYVGRHMAAGVPCHHLAYAGRQVDWQIWIDAGERPLVRKLAITYFDRPGSPQYVAVFRRWDLAPVLPDDRFRLKAPEGALEVEFEAVDGGGS